MSSQRVASSAAKSWVVEVRLPRHGASCPVGIGARSPENKLCCPLRKSSLCRASNAKITIAVCEMFLPDGTSNKPKGSGLGGTSR